MKANDMNLGDGVLAKGLTNRLIYSLRMQQHRGKVKREGDAEGRDNLVAPYLTH